MSNMFSLKWGICGANIKTVDFLIAMSTLPEGTNIVKAVVDLNAEESRKFAIKHNIECFEDDFVRMATSPDIDVVYVCLPQDKQFTLCKLMLENYKHVLCEPPMGINHSETTELVILSKLNEKFLMEAVWSRFFPAYSRLNTELALGQIGEIHQVNANFGYKFEGSPYLCDPLLRGSMMNLSVHVLQFALFIMKQVEPAEIAVSSFINDQDVDENTVILMKYPAGKIAVLSIHTKTHMSNVAEIIGDRGFILVPDFTCPTIIQDSVGIIQFGLPVTDEPVHFLNSTGLSYEISEVGRCIEAGLLESPLMPVEESRRIADLRDIIIRTQRGRIPS